MDPSAGQRLDWVSMNTGCFAASNAVARTSLALSKFVREVRESRSELDSISSELHSLDGVLQLLRDDAASFPPFLAEQTPSALDCCLTLINELEGCISVLNRPGVSRADKKARWMASRDHINRLHWTLGRYKDALGLAVDFVDASKAQNDNDASSEDVDELAEVAARIISTSCEPPLEMRPNRALTTLQQYFDTLREYANLSAPPSARKKPESQPKPPPQAAEAPDSAIEMSCDESSSFLTKKQPLKAPPRPSRPDAVDGTFFDEMDEFSGELHEMPPNMMPIRDVRNRVPPPPPPRSTSRLGSSSSAIPNFSHNQHPQHTRQAPSISDTDSNYYGSLSHAGSSVASRASGQSSNMSLNHKDSMSRIRSFSPPALHPVSEHILAQHGHPPPQGSQQGYYTSSHDHSSQSGDSNSFHGSESRRSSGMNQSVHSLSRYSVFENPRAEIPMPPPVPALPPMSLSGMTRPPTPSSSNFMFSPPQSPYMPTGNRDRDSTSTSGLSGKRSSSRLGTAFSRLGLRSTKHSQPATPTHSHNPSASTPSLAESLTSTNVFGVPVAQSMKVAKGVASTSHEGGSAGGKSARDYPLCILRCVYYIRDMGLAECPHVFGQDGDSYRVSDLREIFNTPQTGYGKVLDWRDFTVYDAADLILVYLNELPKPLVPDSLAKRWIKLSKQSNVAGSMALRIDQGIDFWEEALMGIKGPERSLFKLLLTLWGDIADQAERNEMTAERLAGRVMRPLLHFVPVSAMGKAAAKQAQYETDLLLGIAFMIRKRSEYNAELKKNGGKAAKPKGLPPGF
ncbi:uncharacterized protein QC761_100940 [Podospora bellae-mahoneyi]|uniref:Rho-GAP domain-containing protein n=1 Tax=Podospora bellae-mahoneyi TaxID=2093777 RepID=A0ABR0FTP9_9PEZI|nr:hypothetical protein QC761_100940 [Podospora bellae-mahoneyi]